MKLSAYLEQAGVTESEFAGAVGCSQPTVNKLKKGTGSPSLALALRIASATKGAVMPHDFEQHAEENEATE
jgi:transcriptional regulator with XRE-family HTH domain